MPIASELSPAALDDSPIAIELIPDGLACGPMPGAFGLVGLGTKLSSACAIETPPVNGSAASTARTMDFWRAMATSVLKIEVPTTCSRVFVVLHPVMGI